MSSSWWGCPHIMQVLHSYLLHGKVLIIETSSVVISRQEGWPLLSRWEQCTSDSASPLLLDSLPFRQIPHRAFRMTFGLYPGTDLDSTERLEASLRGGAALSLDLCLPCKGSSWPSGRPSPSDTLPEELSCKSNAQTQVSWNSCRFEYEFWKLEKTSKKVLKFHQFQNKKIILI